MERDTYTTDNNNRVTYMVYTHTSHGEDMLTSHDADTFTDYAANTHTDYAEETHTGHAEDTHTDYPAEDPGYTHTAESNRNTHTSYSGDAYTAESYRDMHSITDTMNHVNNGTTSNCNGNCNNTANCDCNGTFNGNCPCSGAAICNCSHGSVETTEMNDVINVNSGKYVLRYITEDSTNVNNGDTIHVNDDAFINEIYDYNDNYDKLHEKKVNKKDRVNNYEIVMMKGNENRQQINKVRTRGIQNKDINVRYINKNIQLKRRKIQNNNGYNTENNSHNENNENSNENLESSRVLISNQRTPATPLQTHYTMHTPLLPHHSITTVPHHHHDSYNTTPLHHPYTTHMSAVEENQHHHTTTQAGDWSAAVWREWCAIVSYNLYNLSLKRAFYLISTGTL